MRALNPLDFKQLLATDDSIIVLDVRTLDAFAETHIPGALFIPFDNYFEQWLTNLIPTERDILLVFDEQIAPDVAERMQRSGRKAPLGWLKGGMKAWLADNNDYHLVIRVEADELAMDLPYDELLLVVDIRTEAEFAEGHVKDAMNIPLRSLSDMMTLSLIEEEQHLYICGSSDEKSMMAASVLLHQGYTLLRTVDGGWDAIRVQKGIPIEKETDKLN
jgi:rhodanese-related sulfurtransferase